MKTYTIDATGKPIGRLASEIALALQGKQLSSYEKNRVAEVTVEVCNVSKVGLRKKKMGEVHHRSHSGYPGALHEVTVGEAFAKNPARLLRRVVGGMLPKNRLRDRLLKRLMIRLS